MIDILNGVIQAVGVVIIAVLQLLPQSPFDFTNTIDNKFLQFINYILPFSQAAAHLATYVTSVILYYSIRIVLRWIKVAAN